jgi:predicted Zn finger-like uncharacterized protein
MATLLITCPDCKKQMKVPDSVQGKKVRCKSCGGVIPVPAGKKPDTRVTTPEAQAKMAKLSEEEEAKNPYVVTETSLAARCPHCAYEIEPPDALICLHCGYNMVKRTREKQIVAYESTFFDWLLWLGPGILALFAIGALVGVCLYYHYQLPYQMLNQKDVDSLMADRMKAFERDIDSTAYLFHPGIELWVVVVCIWFIWKFLRFAFKRLILNYRPPEKLKVK